MESVSLTDMTELQKAADYYSLKNSSKGKATPNIVWGIINIVLGLFFMLENPVNIVLVFIGIFMLAIGIWSRVAQQLNNLLLDGIALCVAGAWNIVVTILNIVITISVISQGGEPGFAGVAVVAAGWQIMLGIDAFNKYRRYSGVSPQNPGKEMMARIDQITKPVITANANTEKDIILFNKQGTWTPTVWAGKLCNPGTCSIFTSAKRDDIFFLRPDEVEIQQTGKFRKLLKANFSIRGFKFKGTIHPVYLERYEAWKKATQSPVMV